MIDSLDTVGTDALIEELINRAESEKDDFLLEKYNSYETETHHYKIKIIKENL